MEDKKVYDIINSVDDCFFEVAELREVTEILQAGFAMKDEKYGESCMKAIVHSLELIEEHLDQLHTLVDKYGLLKLPANEEATE